MAEMDVMELGRMLIALCRFRCEVVLPLFPIRDLRAYIINCYRRAWVLLKIVGQGLFNVTQIDRTSIISLSKSSLGTKDLIFTFAL